MTTTNEKKPSPTNYSWLEIVPMLVVLFVVAMFIGFFPTLDFSPHVTRPEIDYNNFNNSTLLPEP